MAKTEDIKFKNKAGQEYVITVRELTDTVNDKILSTLAKRGIHLPENAPLKERKELGKETVTQLVEKISVIEADGREREATKQERIGLLAFDVVGNEVVKKAQELKEEEESALEVVSGNFDAPSGSSSG